MIRAAHRPQLLTADARLGEKKGVELLRQEVQGCLSLPWGTVHDTEEETSVVCQYHPEEQCFRYMRNRHLKFLGLEAVPKAGCHPPACSVLPVLPYLVGVPRDLTKHWFYLPGEPRFRHCHNVSPMSQGEIVCEVANIRPKSPHIGRHHTCLARLGRGRYLPLERVIRRRRHALQPAVFLRPPFSNDMDDVLNSNGESVTDLQSLTSERR
ncbi:hypothetical protein E2C01_054106 [Portunus trituberculatus]|uniref:Uncharacterized protein n=1 Tax=Portunus trituberculatus TaxID=210409 RepID=A0A5B7GIE1_PORTR|nr:hypothetical protein [Portunus trituberculatus]